MSKKKVLVIKQPKDKQTKPKPNLRRKKYQVNFEQQDGKVKFAYGDNLAVLEMYVKSIRGKILKVTKL